MSQRNLNLQKLLNLVKNKSKTLFIFDYDGTLTPIVPIPDDAILGERSSETLNKLADLPDTKLAIVSGRSLRNLKQLIQNKLSTKIMLLGTHGAEIGRESESNEYSKYLTEIRNKYIDNSLLDVEEKTLSIAIHYKRYPDPEEIKNKLYLEAENYKEIFRVQEGHKVFEFLPKDINKGKAIDYFHQEFPEYLLVFFGDDLTDNYAFSRVNDFEGISVQVDNRLKDEIAKFFIPSVEKLYELIEAYINSR
jgi:trehalose 6-phosphate phosphatase